VGPRVVLVVVVKIDVPLPGIEPGRSVLSQSVNCLSNIRP